MADTNDTLKKTQQIAAEAVGLARGATPTLKSSIKDWFAEAESSISKNPLLRWPPPSGSPLPPPH